MWQGRELSVCSVALLDARLALDVTRRTIVQGKRRTEGEKVVAEATDPEELRARIADVIWYRKKDHTAAGLAVESYLESEATPRSVDDWLSELERVERAVALASELGEFGLCG
jgi:hypothetical protein